MNYLPVLKHRDISHEDDDDLPCKYELSPLCHPHDHFCIVLSHSVRTLYYICHTKIYHVSMNYLPYHVIHTITSV